MTNLPIPAHAEPETSDIIRGLQTAQVDPLWADPEKRRTNDLTSSAIIILACKPYNWIDQFPPSISIEPELKEKARKRWPDLFLKD